VQPGSSGAPQSIVRGRRQPIQRICQRPLQIHHEATVLFADGNNGFVAPASWPGESASGCERRRYRTALPHSDAGPVDIDG
jgi:hypothetical protein